LGEKGKDGLQERVAGKESKCGNTSEVKTNSKGKTNNDRMIVSHIRE
jgi:hypothetical protein